MLGRRTSLSLLLVALLLGMALPAPVAARSGQQAAGGAEVPGMGGRARAGDRGGVTAPRPAAAPPSQQLQLLGSHDLGGRGFNADVWVEAGFAYVGTWGAGPENCPGGGVRVLDIRDPERPRMVTEFAAYRGTTAEDMMTVSVGRPSRTILGVGLQACDEGGRMGLDLWDVTDPRRPRHLSFLDTGHGVHELFLHERGDRAYALLAVPFSEVVSAGEHGEVDGDLRIVDITDPRRPRQVADWTAGRDAGLVFGAPFFGEPGEPAHGDCTPPPGAEPLCRGNDFPAVFLHSVSANQSGTRAYLAYWDAGMIILDIADPARPRLIGRTSADLDEEGNTHSAIVAPGDRLAVTTDEDFSPLFDEDPPPGDHWGFAHLYDVSNPARPVELSQISTPNARTTRADGDYSVHNPVLRGNLLYLSWYSDGVQVFDISQPRRPRFVASFVPPAAPDPFGVLPTAPEVWGVVVSGRLVVLSDMNSGLYVLRRPTGRCTITGTAGDDVLTGTSGDDVICGLGGDDRLVGLGGDDVLRGGPGNDRLQGDEGDDALVGGPGRDTAHGGAGDDDVRGGPGGDWLSGGSGADVVFGDEGDDRLWGDVGNDYLHGSQGDDAHRGGLGDDLCNGAGGTDDAAGCEQLLNIP